MRLSRKQLAPSDLDPTRLRSCISPSPLPTFLITAKPHFSHRPARGFYNESGLALATQLVRSIIGSTHCNANANSSGLRKRPVGDARPCRTYSRRAIGYPHPTLAIVILAVVLISLHISALAQLRPLVDSAAAANDHRRLGDDPLGLPQPTHFPAVQQRSTTIDLSDGPRDLSDELGPVVINKDGTIARITNWSSMTDAERRSTLRIITKRNRQRLQALKETRQQHEPPKSDL